MSIQSIYVNSLHNGTMAESPPPGIDLNADQGPRLVGSMITLIVLPTLFVIARLVSRKVARAGYWWDDLLVILACVSDILSRKYADAHC